MIQVIVHLNLDAFFCAKKMIWLLAIVGVLILVLTMLLFIPIRLYVNTKANQYFASFGNLIKAFLEGDTKEILRFRIRVVGFEFILYPLKMKKKPKKKAEPFKKTTGKRPKPRQLFRVLKAFELKKFELNVDTGDYVTNAKLYPIFGFVNHHFARCQINFKGINYLVFDIRSRPLTLLKSFIHN